MGRARREKMARRMERASTRNVDVQVVLKTLEDRPLTVLQIAHALGWSVRFGGERRVMEAIRASDGRIVETEPAGQRDGVRRGARYGLPA